MENKIGYMVKSTIVGTVAAVGLMTAFPSIGYEIRDLWNSIPAPRMLMRGERYHHGLEGHFSPESSDCLGGSSNVRGSDGSSSNRCF